MLTTLYGLRKDNPPYETPERLREDFKVNLSCLSEASLQIDRRN